MIADDNTTTFEYTYNVLEDTSNVYSIQLFTDSDEFSFEENELTVDFQKFVDFYGIFHLKICDKLFPHLFMF